MIRRYAIYCALQTAAATMFVVAAYGLASCEEQPVQAKPAAQFSRAAVPKQRYPAWYLAWRGYFGGEDG